MLRRERKHTSNKLHLMENWMNLLLIMIISSKNYFATSSLIQVSYFKAVKQARTIIIKVSQMKYLILVLKKLIILIRHLI